MKKLAATVATGILIAGVTVSNVSAAEVEVHKGDTLWGISRAHNITVEEIMDTNSLKSTIIQPNQLLLIKEQYTVKKGDTLSGIGNEFGVTIDDLKGWNNLNSDLITINQVLTINGGTNGVQETAPVTKEAQVDVKEEPKEEVTEEPQAEVEEEPKEEVTEEPQAEVEEEPKEEVTEEPQAEVKEKPEEEVTEEPQAKVEEEPEEEVIEEPQAVVKTEPKEQLQKEAKAEPQEKANAEAKAKPQEEVKSEEAEGKVITATATAYTAKCDGCTGITSTGVDLNENPNAKVIAVDPSVIPLGSKVHVEGYGYATAADTGSAIKGNKIDVHVPNKAEAIGWGVKTVKVTIVK